MFAINTKHKQNNNIDKKDYFFAWLGKRDERNWKMIIIIIICFCSFIYTRLNFHRQIKIDIVILEITYRT